MKTYLRLLKYVKPYWFPVFAGIICMLILSVTNIAIIPLVGMLSRAIGAKDLGALNNTIIITALIFFAKGIFTYGQIYLLALVGQKIIKDIRVRVFEHIHDLSLDFFSKWRTGDIMSRILGDITIMQNSMVSSITELVPSLVSVFGITGYMLYLNWRLTLISLLAMPMIGFVVTKFGQQIRIIAMEAQKKAADISSLLQENLAGIRVIRSFSSEKREVKKFASENEQSLQLALLETAMNATQTPLVSFIQTLAVLFVIWYGGFEVVAGRLAPSDLIAFFAGITLLAEPTGRLANMNAVIQKSISSGERVFEVLDIKPTVKEKTNARSLNDISGSVEFKNVSFKYEESQTEHILNNISITVKAGEIVALVGPSGAGKTTFVNLIPRFWDPISGKLQVYIAALGDEARVKGAEILKDLRGQGIISDIDYLGKSLKSQMKTADRLGAEFVIIIGEDELKRDIFVLKDMKKQTQEEFRFDQMMKQFGLRGAE